MGSILRVYWYRYPEGCGNFGDEVNPYLIQKLSGRKVVFVTPYHGSRWESLKTVAYLLLKDFRSLSFVMKSSPWSKLFNLPVIFGIGSIIRFCDTNIKVWGSGIISQNDPIPTAIFLAVRGQYTRQRLKDLGVNTLPVLGDPALLLPLVYPGNGRKTYKIGIIPHHIHFVQIKKNFSNPDILILNLLDPIEKIIDQITSCEFTVSTSLHGIIVSHAYQIPSLWIKPEGIELQELSGNNIKFADYFSSVDLPPYDPILIDLTNIYSIEEKIHAEIFLAQVPSHTIDRVQADLLAVAPFKLKKKFRKWMPPNR